MLARPLIGVLAVATLGCRQDHGVGRAAPAGRFNPTYNRETGRLERVSTDLDRDGRTDAWLYLDGVRLLRAEFDEDRDGRVDRTEYYRSAATSGDLPRATSVRGGPAPFIERAERSTRRDGRISRWEYYELGRLRRIEEDTNADGRVDKWETYVDGRMDTLTLDTYHRGTPDRRLVYRSDGTLDRLELDPDGDGRFVPAPVNAPVTPPASR
jgi:hypothetical protein